MWFRTQEILPVTPAQPKKQTSSVVSSYKCRHCEKDLECGGWVILPCTCALLCDRCVDFFHFKSTFPCLLCQDPADGLLRTCLK